MSLNSDTDAVLSIDAENKLNSINRKVMLHNLKFICPIIATYIIHCYATPSRLFNIGLGEILSSVGTTSHKKRKNSLETRAEPVVFSL